MEDALYAVLSLIVASTEIGLDHPWVHFDLGRRAIGYAGPKVEDRHPVGDRHDRSHVVFDEHDAQAERRPDLGDRPRHRPLLPGAHAGDRLVQQQQ